MSLERGGSREVWEGITKGGEGSKAAEGIRGRCEGSKGGASEGDKTKKGF